MGTNRPADATDADPAGGGDGAGTVAVHGRRWAGPPGAPAVVCVHGLGVSGRYFAPLAARLRAVADVQAPDLPGFGATRGPRRALAVAELADALAAWAAAAVGRPATVVAHSMGCQVAVEWAVRHPHAVEALVLVGPTVDPEARSVVAQLGRWLVDLPRERPAIVPLVAPDYARSGLRRIAATARLGVAHDVERWLPALTVPTVVARGGRDPVAPARWVDRAAALVPGGRSATVPGAGHAAHHGAPDHVARLVADVLRAAAPR